MASLSDILTKRFAGTIWTLLGDDYATLAWDAGNTVAKPVEADLRALSDAVDADLAADRVRARQMAAILSQPDTVLMVFEVLAAAIDDMQGKLRAAAITSPLAAAAVAAVGTLRSRLAQVRNIT